MTKLLAALFGIAVFIGLLWLLFSIINATGSGGSGVVGIIALILIVIFGAIALTASEKFKEKSAEVNLKIAKEKEQTQIINQTKKDLNEYQSYKHSYSLCSDNFLISNYKKLKDDNIENMETLACEEEMVKRGLLDYSPMHEKLLIIKRQFKI